MTIVVLVGAVTMLSAFVKNIGALAMLMPVAFQLARRSNTSPSYLLMPMAFGSLLGGTMTLIGTSPNVIVSRMRDELVGEPFRMFDFTPVGATDRARRRGLPRLRLPAAARGPQGRSLARRRLQHQGATRPKRSIPEESPLVGKTVADLERSAMARSKSRPSSASASAATRRRQAGTLLAGDMLLLEGEPAALERVVALGKLQLAAAKRKAPPQAAVDAENFGVMEAVVTADSPLVDNTAAQAQSRRALSDRPACGQPPRRASGASPAHHQVPARRRDRAAGRPYAHAGSARRAALPAARQRDIRLGRGRRRYVPILVLAAAMALVAFQIVPVAFGSSAPRWC